MLKFIGLMTLAAFTLAATPLPDAAAKKDDVPAVVARIVAAYGGEARLAKLAAVRETGTVTSVMRHTSGKVVRLHQGSDHLRVDVSYPDSPENRILNGARGWRDGEEVSGAQLDAMMLQAARLNLPSLLLQKKAALRDLGTAKIDDATIRSLEIPLTETASVIVEIDVAAGRIVRSISQAKAPNSSTGKIEFMTAYSDFRTVDGLLFPFHEDNIANGFVTGSTVLEKIELLPMQSDSLFEPVRPGITL